MRIGVLGGTFDPIHTAHLMIAEEARQRLGLEEVVFVPAGDPWMKADRALAPASRRLDMARLAVESNPFFRVSTAELDRPGPSYTVETLRELADEYGPGVELFFIMGGDAFAGFDKWKDPQGILVLAKLAVVDRPGGPTAANDSVDSGRVIHIPGVNLSISASEIRKRVAERVTIRYMTPDAVADYILINGLYTS